MDALLFVLILTTFILSSQGFMHELGHGFGSGHSHDISYYDVSQSLLRVSSIVTMYCSQLARFVNLQCTAHH